MGKPLRIIRRKLSAVASSPHRGCVKTWRESFFNKNARLKNAIFSLKIWWEIFIYTFGMSMILCVFINENQEYMSYITSTSRTRLMLPCSIDEYVSPDNTVRFTDAFADKIIAAYPDLFQKGKSALSH
jgi:hypothetical protein